ncbi:LOW QUALITY PROTEIN: uncharacterized protein LOC128386390 [Panonychus citri]|uniref:LOW QUALITY PROTEIN: uncharacterized protein LOC128386390 n=1 Tax=Panonychus citri TaxID=50023 RepID=UPI0023070731|nr:LOW QUALITY PROTEIN: uncharacterized protein LOC128386390 [Panonychus citri]
MSFNDLPNECLCMILDKIFELEELIKLSKVCSKWSSLISLRYRKIKYLLIKSNDDRFDLTKILMNDQTIKDHNLRELLPNLRILSIPAVLFGDELEFEDVKKLVDDNPKIKGLIRLYSLNSDLFHLLNLENIEMISVKSLEFDYKKVFRPDQLKQIRLYETFITELPQYVEYFPSLKRLNISLLLKGGERIYKGPNLSNLKILELYLSEYEGNFHLFHFMDFCPSLESTFIRSPPKGEYIDISLKNYNLRDLVIEMSWGERLNWSFFCDLLSKFPNLHHLAIRGSGEINDDRIEELVTILPEIKLLDFRGSKNVTEKSADILSEYCLRSHRSIEIYYNRKEEPFDWPKLNTPQDSIVYGLDFMKHCFYKYFCDLPDLIDE